MGAEEKERWKSLTQWFHGHGMCPMRKPGVCYGSKKPFRLWLFSPVLSHTGRVKAVGLDGHTPQHRR